MQRALRNEQRAAAAPGWGLQDTGESLRLIHTGRSSEQRQSR